MNDTTLQVLLVAILLLPAAGTVAALLPAPPGLRGRNPEQAVLRHGVTVTGLVFLLSVVLAAGFDHDRSASMQATTDISWIPALGIRVHLGVDGISLPLVVLTTLLTFLCAVYSYVRMPEGPGPRAFVALLLLLESGMLGTFTALDLMVFFLAFEIVLVPMYFLIARWGGGGRGPAAYRFILYTLLGSAVMLLGLLLIGVQAGTFDMVELAQRGGDGLTRGVQITAVLAVGLGLAVKAPMWPLHSWLPGAHTAAPTVGSVLLAGVLLKMGTYGLVRVLLPVAPEGMKTLAPYLGAFAVVGIVYGSLVCLALARPPAARTGKGPALPGQAPDSGPGSGGDLKRLIAYSSVGHMGFVLLGIATLTPTGVNGALFANIAHGLITGLLFFLVGAIKERYGTTDLGRIAAGSGGALYGKAPRLGGLLAFAAVASLGLPGLAGFWGEMLTLFGAFRPAEGLSRPTYLVFMVVGGIGTLLTAAYLLLVVRRVCTGEHPSAAEEAGAGAEARAGTADGAGARTGTAEGAGVGGAFTDVQPHEFAAWTPLVALTVVAGLWPALLLGLSDPAVQTFLGGNR